MTDELLPNLGQKTPGPTLTATAPGRLDAFIADSLGVVSRRRANAICGEDRVLVNGRPQRAGYMVKPGDEVVVLGEVSSVTARPGLFAAGSDREGLGVLFEDDWMVAVSKPSQMHSVTLRSDDPQTLADFISAVSPKTFHASPDLREAGLVQRLDFYTSGVVLAAKDPETWRTLHRGLTGTGVLKNYFALVQGTVAPENKIIEQALAPSSDGTSMRAVEDGLPAKSEICAVVHLPENEIQRACSLVQIRGQGMRRHQVRAHLASIGHPLIGDKLYGSASATVRLLPSKGKLIDRPGFFLHAQSVELTHPKTGKQLRIDANWTEFGEGVVQSYFPTPAE